MRESVFLNTATSQAERRNSASSEAEAWEGIKEPFVQIKGPASVQLVCDAGSPWNLVLHNFLEKSWNHDDEWGATETLVKLLHKTEMIYEWFQN